MKKPNIIHQPYYPGGKTAMAVYLQKHLVYPQAALAAGVEGAVHLRYDIDHKGKVVEVTVTKGIGHGCDEEAIRLVSGMRFSIPQKARGLRILYHKTLKVHFHLPKAQPTTDESAVQQTGGLRYTIVPDRPKADPSATRGYTYSINLPDDGDA